MSLAIQEYYVNTFKRNICSACKLCEPVLPAFCMSIYGGDQKRFFEIIKHIKVLQAKGTSDIICTFEGFCGLFCNSQKPCPKRNKDCEGLQHVFNCYESFAKQSGIAIPLDVKTKIWELFCGINMKTVGRQYRLPTKNFMRSIDKKKRKKINKLIRKTQVKMRSEIQFPGFINSTKTKLVKKKKPVITTMFCNDDEAWIKKIDSYLESDETNNRQSAKST